MSILELYKKIGLKYGSVVVKLDNNSKKTLSFVNGWKSAYNKSLNGIFIETGEINNLCVLDLDNIYNEICCKLKQLADKCCNMVIKTRKGYHYYFELDKRLTTRRQVKKYEFDYLANNSIVLCPPTTYQDTNNNKYSYEIVKIPDSDHLHNMSEELIDLLQKIFDESKPKYDKINKIINKEIKNTKESNNNTTKISTDDLLLVLNGLNNIRAIDYNYWIIVGLVLKHEGHDAKIWDDFSKRSDKYNEGEPLYLWKYLNPHTVTIGTLMHWLKTDNNDVFVEIVKKKKLNNYDADIDLNIELQFNDHKMLQLMDDDVKYLGEFDYESNIKKTKSFKYFNKFHVHIRIPNLFFLIEFSKNQKQLILIQDMNAMYSHLLFGKKEKQFTNIWKKSIYRNMYKLLDFLPNLSCPIDTYNTFYGFAYDSDNKVYDMNKIKPLLDHINFVVNGNTIYYNYIIKYFAHIRQFPWRKTLTSIILYSDTHGSGKNTVFEMFMKIFKRYTAKMREDDINTRFNKMFEGKLFIYGDEIKGNNKHDADILKNMITQTEIKIEPKGKESYIIKDFSNICFTTNHSVAIKIENLDRRFFVIACKEEKKDKLYYINLYNNYIENDEVMYEFDKYLSTLDLTQFFPEDIPSTEQKTQMILYNLPGHIQMIKDNASDLAGKTITAKDLLKMSKQFSMQNKLSYSYTETKVFRDFSHFFGEYKMKTPSVIKYNFPDDFGDKVDNLIAQKIGKK